MKAKYLSMFDSRREAVEFEEYVLGATGEKAADTDNYWLWLIDQYLAS